ncbi:MAG: thiamine-phosphate kinase [uncultured archaeon A07HR60]|nr:MAG: thiamine-phosphate kinase [uncultured archaeon A07HR60]
MDERAALRKLASDLPKAGDDAAIIGDTAITTDMLHTVTDFPDGTTRYTAGWRAVGASLSDLAAVGATVDAAVAVYADDSFVETELTAFVRGATDVCELVGGSYVGGDLDENTELTVATTAIGEVDDPVLRSGATPGDVVCVTGHFGRSAAALRLFHDGHVEKANELFRFRPRIETGRLLRQRATAAMDSSDGLARSLHQLAEASGVGFDIDSEAVPVHPELEALATDSADRWDRAVHFGEDFELVFTLPESRLPDIAQQAPDAISQIGTVVESGITVDGATLPDRGYTHDG